MRDKLLETAVDHFGRMGFEGAATRAIAAESGTAMSSITYHFGGKEGLYIATAEHIAGQIAALQRPGLDAARQACPQNRAEAIAAIADLVDSFAVLMLGRQGARWARFIIREQQEPTEAFERIFALAMEPAVKVFLDLLEIARPDLDQIERRATGFLLFGQTLAMRAGRASMCRVMGKADIDPETEQIMRARIRANVLCILSDGPETAS